MSYTTCPGCGTEVDQFDVESRRYGTTKEIKRRLAILSEADDDVCIDGVYYSSDGFAIHDAHRCRAMRKRPDCGHSRDCDGPDGRCEWCQDVDDAISAAQEATRELFKEMAIRTVRVLIAHAITDDELTAICSEIGEGTAKWMREDRDRVLGAMKRVANPAEGEA